MCVGGGGGGGGGEGRRLDRKRNILTTISIASVSHGKLIRSGVEV